MPVDPVYTVVRLERSAAAQTEWAARARVITGVAMKRVTRWRCRMEAMARAQASPDVTAADLAIGEVYA